MIDLSSRPALGSLVEEILTLWPEHEVYIEKSLAGRSPEVLDFSDALAGIVRRLAAEHAGGMPAMCADYRFLCEEIILPEELHFRRNGTYRLSRFEDANRECYANAPFMDRYMNGVLVSNVIWDNHAHAMAHFANTYLPGLAPGAAHLEVGPGHGVFLYWAAASDKVGAVSGWDISPTSIEKTRKALAALGVAKPVSLTLRDPFAADQGGRDVRFDSIAMSEVLEHLENPAAALRAASGWLRPGGSIWINVPANSPAPDHIFLFESPEHAQDVVRSADLEVVDAAAYPMSGATLERARKRQLSISCVVVARKK